MNFKLILIITLGLLIIISGVLFGVIAYSIYSNQKQTFEDNKWLIYSNIGVLVISLMVNGIIFLKAR